MARYNVSYEGGTVGVAPATSSTMPGPYQIQGTVTFDSAQAAHGTRSVKHVATSGDVVGVYYGNSSNLNFASTALAVRAYFYLPAVPTAAVNLLSVYSSTDTRAAVVGINASGKLYIRDSVSSSLVAGTVNVSANTWVRLELYVTAGTSGATVNAAMYAADSTTATDTVSSSAGNTATTLSSLRVGKENYSSYADTYWVDDVAIETAATGFVGPLVNAAPSVNAGVDQNVSASATVNLSATASDSDGSIASYAWTYDYPASGGPTLTGASTATPSFTAGSAGALYVLRCTVTDNGGATSYDTVEVAVPLTGAFTTLPMAGTKTGTWTLAGSATTDGAALADSDDTTYTESPDYSSTAATAEYRLQPLAARGTLQFVVRTAQTVAGGTVTVSLVDGTTVRQTWTVAQTTSAANTTLTVTNPAAISNWSNLRLRFSVVS